MDNPRLLQHRIGHKLESLDKLKDADFSYDAFENPSKLLAHYKEELHFFEQGKQSLARMVDMPRICEEEEQAYEALREFYLVRYPELELNLRRVIQVLEKRLKEGALSGL